MTKDTTKLNPTESQIVFLITQEKSTSQIATELQINLNEVIDSRQRIYKKLGILNTAGMIRRAFELKILATKGDRCILVQ